MIAPPTSAETPSTDVTGVGDRPEWTIDELAGLTALPVRTIREYQTLGILPAPRRDGRVGRYGRSHLQRLQLISRLRDRGYSLAGIGDLLTNWSSGADLSEVLGLHPDQLVHVDEPGAPATLEQLADLLPALIPGRLDELEATGVIERCAPHGYCVPSPSLLQLAIDSLDAGLSPDDVLGLLASIRRAAELVADEVLERIGRLPADAEPGRVAALLGRGRGLLAHGVGRMTLHRVGLQLGVADETDLERAFRSHVEQGAASA